MPNIKIRLKRGPHEIEAEGTTADVESFLAKYWNPVSFANNPLREEDELGGEEDRSVTVKKPKSRPRRSQPDATEDETSFDANALANKIKEHKLFPTIDKKLIHVKGILFRKASLVMWINHEALSSGQIINVLAALGVKADQGNLSNALKDNITSLMPDKARSSGKARYRLTAAATTEFEAWLKKTDE